MICILLAIFCLLVPAASAVTITESPDNVQKGDTVTLTITDLPDGSSFSLLIGGKFGVTPGERFSFATRSFNMPFTLNKGTVSATTQGTKSTAFEVSKGDALVRVSNSADANGYFTISKDYEIESGVYDYLMLSGRARTDTSVITSSMNLIGTKKGVTSSVISFTIDGIDNGEVYLTALVNGNQVLYKKVTVGSGIATPATTVTTEPVTTEPVETTTTGSSVTTTKTTSPSGIVSTTDVTTSSTTASGSTTRQTTTASFSSADRVTKLTAQGIDYAAILMVSEVNPPADWVMVTDAYKIAPESLVFASPATLSFDVPSSYGDYAYFVARLNGDEWVVVPSSAGDTTIDAEIDRVGTYALMGYKPESTLPPTTIAGQTGTAAGVTSSSAAAPKGTLRVASIAHAQQVPGAAATTKPSSLDPFPVLLALGICSLALLVIRKRE